MKKSKSVYQVQFEYDESEVIYQECFYEYSALETAEAFARNYFADKRDIENFIQPTELSPRGSFNLENGVHVYIIFFSHVKDCLPMWKIILKRS